MFAAPDEVTKMEIEPQPVILPDDVLYCLFKFLSVDDRKTARLVCRQWYRMCSCRIFHQEEAFFFCGASFRVSWLFMSAILIDTGRDSYNLKLENYVIDEKSLHLWGRCGLKIRSLQINECLFRYDIMMHWIMLYCPNMEHFSVNNVNFLNPNCLSYEHVFWPYYQFPQFLPRMENLQSFKFESEFLEFELNNIYVDFPNIKTLAASILDEKFEQRFENLLELLTSGSSRVDTLSLDFEGDEYLSIPTRRELNLSTMRKYDLSKLKSVELKVSLYTLNDTSLTTILHYKFWTSLTITSHHTESRKFSDFLFLLLGESPQLEKLKIFWEISHHAQFYKVFPAFVRSRLRSLDVEIDDRWLLFEELDHLLTICETTLMNLPANNTVTSLSLYNHLETDCFSNIFMNGHFPQVRHLKVIRANLNTVFTTMKKLKALRAEYNCAVHWPIQVANSNEPITNMEFLSISIFNYERLFSNSFWPALKYLSLDCSTEELIREPIWKHWPLTERFRKICLLVSRSAPNLRGFHLKLDLNHVHFGPTITGDINTEILNEFFTICLNFKHLRYIWAFVGESKITKSIAKRRLMTCHQQLPSLRAAFCMTDGLKLSTFLNSVRNKVDFLEHEEHFKVDPFEYWLKGR